MKLRVHGATDPGLVRRRNEDSLLVDEALRLFAVADGIGGMPGGDVASRTAIATLRSAVAENRDLLNDLRSLVQRAAGAVRNAGREFGHEGIGTTLTLGFFGNGAVNIGHVGDSFALLVRRGACRALTREHNVENERVDIASLAPYPPGYRYALTRALGQPDPFEVDLVSEPLEANDRVILATDGLTDLVEPAQMAGLCMEFPEPGDCAAELIKAALQAGGHDNITLVLIAVDEV